MPEPVRAALKERSRSWRRLRVLTLFFGTLLALQVTVYAGWLAWTDTTLPQGSWDLFAVFGGDPDRAHKGLVLARYTDVDAWVVSDAPPESVQDYIRTWGPPGKARILYEPLARGTVQNAVNVARLIRAEGFRSVVLATSWYHAPRAYLMLRLELWGSGVRIHPVATEPIPAHWWKERRLYLEFPKLWGSLARWAWKTL